MSILFIIFCHYFVTFRAYTHMSILFCFSMKKILILLSVFFLSPLPLLAQVMIVEVLPNTIDDANLEYIDIANTGCASVDIGWYTLSDKVKSYVFPSPSVIDAHTTYRVGRPSSRVELNNTNEELTLRDSSDNIVHTFSYATSEKWWVLVVPGIVYDVCETEESGGATVEEWDIEEEYAPDEETTTTETGSVVDIPEGESGDIENTWWTVDIPTWAEDELIDLPDEESSTGESIDDSVLEEDELPSLVSEIQTSNFLGQSGSLVPQILLYDDTDNDGHIDTLEILYDISITGSLDITRVSLYSNTGGLYSERINTLTGYITGYEIENNILRLSIRPSDYDKNSLNIDNTTQSELRIKFSAPTLSSLSGEILPDVTLTSSFDAYSAVYSWDAYDELIDPDASGDILETESIVVDFPQIVPTIQNYTNTTLSGETFVCRETPCRLNLNFESIFTSQYPASGYTCQVRYAGSIENKCNPTQWNPTWPWEIEFILTHRATWQMSSKKFPVLWNIISTNTTSSTPYTTRPAPPRANIALNGILSRSQIHSGTNIECLSGTCSVNFDSTGSVLVSGVDYTYLWTSSGRVLSDRKNPWAFQFAPGSHRVLFTITDSVWQSSTAEYEIIVHLDTISDTDMSLAGATDSVKKSKKSKVVLFSPPSIIIDNPSDAIVPIEWWYRCVSTAKTCSINFSLADTVNDVEYRWNYAHEQAEFITTNPRSRAFSPWRYRLSISAYSTWGTDPIWTGEYTIESIQHKKSKAKKQATKTNSSKKTSSEKITDTASPQKVIELIPSAYADGEWTETSVDRSILFVLFVSIFINIFFFRRRKW